VRQGPARTRYATTVDGVHIAYQVAEHGPVDLVLLQDWTYPLEGRWDEPVLAGPTLRLSSFGRVLSFDRRGIGLSDPVGLFDMSTPEHWLTDLHAAMDAAGMEHAVIVGANDGSQIAQLFAAAFPDRTDALVILNGTARVCRDESTGYPGVTREQMLEHVAHTDRWWGGATPFRMVAPSLTGDDELMHRLARLLRHQGSLGSAQAMLGMLNDFDTRAIVPTIRTPTLVVHRAANTLLPVEQGRYLAEHIPGAAYAEVPGIDHAWWAGDFDALLDEVQHFATGVRPRIESDRGLATVLFTDIVDSTRRANEVGDHRWLEVLDAHDAMTASVVREHRGRVIRTTGDGCLAVFDGPGRAVRCGEAIRDGAADMGLQVRVGVHTGEIEQRGADIGGIAVHIGARVAALATPGDVFVSRTVVDLVAGSGMSFAEEGTHELKGVPGSWQIFAAAS
jgi:class 3 adenylate cyclase